MKLFTFILFCTTLFVSYSQQMNFLSGNDSPTYDEVIDFYKKLARQNSDIKVYEMGNSDYGKSIYLCVLGAEQDSLSTFEKARNGTTLLINNAIHPGEPCGVDASMQLALNYTKLKNSEKKSFPLIAIIPAYNVGGMHNRTATSRANQEGPNMYGFRGNSRNLDLNRDFIKMDSRNAWTFTKIFHALDPDVFIDTHTSNGADYQHTMTYIAPLKDRFDQGLTKLTYEHMLPAVEQHLQKNWNFDLIPYVSMNARTLDKGIHAFNALPRYASGYAELFNTIAITTETHMLKPFEDRVKSTFGFIEGTVIWMSKNKAEIEEIRNQAFENQKRKAHWPIRFVLDDTWKDSILLKGYEWEMRPSQLTKQDRLFYNREKPIDLWIPFLSKSIATDTIKVPKFIIVGGQEHAAIERLKMNNIEFSTIDNSADTSIDKQSVTQFRINDFKTVSSPYEGRYLHSNASIEQHNVVFIPKSGDILIPVKQRNIAYLLHTLDPRNEDSFFAWNFFDSYLQQKEYFSDYVFEEKALDFLKNNPDIETEFRELQKRNESFASNRWEQLMWIYQRSPYYEANTHRMLPVFYIY